jgi:sodium transport system permease protein
MRALHAVLGAELRQLLRDLNTLLFSVLFPLFLFPLVVWAFSQAQGLADGWREGLRPRVAAPAALAAELPDTVEVVAPDAPAEVTVTQKGSTVKVRYRSADPVAAEGKDRVVAALDHPWTVDTHDVAPDDQALTAALARVLPGLLVVLAALASMFPAVEAVVADRERGTLETSLVTAAPRWVFVAGKLVSVGVVTLVAMASTLVGALVTLAHLASLTGAAIGLPPLRLLTILPLAAGTALAGAALALLAAAPMRSFKQAQNTVTMVSTTLMGAACVGMLPRAELDGALGFVPVTNAVLVMREVLLGHPPWGWAAVAAAELVLVAGVATTWAARSMGRLEVR